MNRTDDLHIQHKVNQELAKNTLKVFVLREDE